MSGDGFPNSLRLLYTYGVVERIRNTLSSGDVEGLEGFRGRMDEYFSLFADNYPRLIEYIYSGDGESAKKVATRLLRIKAAAYAVEDLVATYKLISEDSARISMKTPTMEEMSGKDSINQFWRELDKLLQDTVAFHAMSFGSYPYLLCAPSLHRITEGRGASCRYYGEIWSLPDGETIVGLDSKKEEIIRWIFNDNTSNKCPKFISIEGEAGAGKTTLAKMIYNQVSTSFDLRLWALAPPKSSDLRATLVELIRSSTNQSRSHLQRMEVQKLKRTLQDILAGKKYLLVVDDYAEEFGRELLNIILKVGLAGSTVILVSAEHVSEATKRWELLRLSETDSWSLFARCAGFDEEREEDDPSFMTRIGRSIAENCHGCPQAIKTLGSLLLTNRDEISWRGVKARIIWTSNRRYTAASKAFNASVEQMSADLLHCLYVFSIMSNYKVMPKDQLIFSWMALGLLHTRDEIRDPVVIGQRYCDELASRCILQLFQSDGLPMVLLNKQADSLHWLIKVVESALPRLLLRKHDRYLIWRGDESSMYKDLAEDFSNVTTFQFQNHVGALSKRFLRKLISRMKYARVLLLDGSEFAKLPKTIGTLKLVKYLSFAGNVELRELPESICSLPNLQTLDLSGCCRLQTLPRNMHKLRHLFLSTRRTKLPELPWASLHHLRICSSRKLSSLPEQIPPLSALKVLQIHDCPKIASLPDRFLEGLPSLEEISIANCELLDLTNWRGLRVLMRLEYLHIQGLPKLSNFPEGLHSVAHSLQHFVVSNCRSLKSLPEDLRSCRNLVEMVIENCSKLATLPKGIHEMTQKVLKIINCPKLITRGKRGVGDPLKKKRGVGDDWHLISHIPKIQLDHQVYQPGYVPRTSKRVKYSKAGTSSQQESYNSSEISEIMSNPSYRVKHFDRSRAVPLPYTYGVLKRICDMATSLYAEKFVKDLNDVFVEFRSVYPILFKCIYSGDGHAKGVVTCLDRLRTVAYDTEDLVAINQLYQQELRSTSPSLMWYSRNLCDSIAELRDSFRVLADIMQFQGSSPVQFLFDPDEFAASSLLRGASCRYYGNIWSLPDGETIVGLDSKKEEIIQWIFNDNPSNQCPKFISIQGETGTGKTTLAKMIYNQVSTSFDLRLWALAPPTSSDLRATLVEILRYSTNQSQSDLQRMDRRSLDQKLYGVLSGKKYLLVLDVHSTDEHLSPADWAELRQILAVGLAGSTVITTTCTDITAKCFQVQSLQEDDCWSLFAQSAGFEEEEEKTHPSFLTSIGKSLIASCVGNPWKIKTLGGVLRNKRDELFWKQIEDSRILQPEIGNLFEISAKHMSCELLHCLYLSFYLYTCTRDNVISRDKLIHCWMAMDLLHSRDKAEDPIDIGNRYCEELASRCFFQLFHSDGHAMVLLQKPDEMFGRALPEVELLPYEEHGFDRFRAALPLYEVRLISENKHSVIWSDHLRRSPGTNQFEGQTRSFPDKLISRMKYARVLLLDGSEFARLPETIGTLKLVKYLSFAGNVELSALPKSICSLPNLQTLDLSGCCGLQTLPRKMHKLVRLRHLFLSTSMNELVKLPRASLHHLRICSSPKLSSLPEQLPPLTLRALKVLQIHDCPKIASLPDRFLEGLPSLEEISIVNCELLDLTNWRGLRVLMRLEYLQIQGLPKLSNFPEGLHSVAHSLQHFVVSNCQSMIFLPEDLESCRNLVEMVIENCSNLATLPEGILEMNLQVLKIINCPKLITRCKMGEGHLISHIPKIQLDHQVYQPGEHLPLRPPGTVGVIRQISPRPPMLGIRPPVTTGLVRPPVVPMVTLVEKPQTTVYVGKIATTVENDFMLSLLQFCGAVKSWKRSQDPSNGTPEAFGFCEFESAEGALRAVRLLSKVNIDGQELVLNVAKEKETPKPTEIEEKGTKEGEMTKVEKTEGDEKTEQPKPGDEELRVKNESGSKEDDTGGLLSDEDREADREASEKIANTIEERLRNRPPPLPLKLDVTATPNSEGPVRSAEKDSDIDVKKDEKTDDEMTSETKASNRAGTESPERGRRYEGRGGRERDRDRDVKREKERELERIERERERERARREREREAEIQKAERMYKERVKEWEVREKERKYQRKYDKEREKEKERERRRLVQDQEDESDDDSRRRRRGGRREVEDKRKRRQREREEDLADRFREEQEIAEAKIIAEAEEQQKQLQAEAAFKLSSAAHANGNDKVPSPDAAVISSEIEEKGSELNLGPRYDNDPSELQDTEVLREVSVVEESEDPCSIFLLLPEDYEIEKDKLIQLWMAGKWINDEQHGDKLFSSFFQNGYLSHCSSNLEIGKARYKIVAQKIKALRDRQKGNAESIRHVSLGCNAEIDAKTFKAIEMFTQLRTLLFLGNRDHGAIQIPRHLFSVFNHLVTLDISGTRMKELPSSIKHIRGLRYLDLSWTLIEWLPDILCTLVQLQTLNLRGCYNLTVLPEKLHQLAKLRHLDFDVLGQLEIMPPKMGKLVDLRTLPAFLVGTGDGRKILELNKVNSLSGELCIANLENVVNGDEAKAAALTYKEHLKTLELRWTSSEICGMHDNSEVILEKLEPSKKLEELKITCYEGESFPGWIEDPDFCNLTSIVLYRCENLLYVPVVEQLPNLKHLRLVRMNGVKEIVNEQEQRNYAAFPSLEKLEINEMQSLENWDWKNSYEGDFSSLSHLIIEDCPKLARFDVVSHLPSIRLFEIRNCPKLETLSDRRLPDSLEELIVDDCPPLQQRFVEGGEDWHKIEHVLNKSISEVDEDEWITDTSD